MEITNRYLERFGRALIGIYYLPPLAENWKFTVFINSLQVTLRRMDLMPIKPTDYSKLASAYFRYITLAIKRI